MGTFKHEQRACGHETTVAAQGLGDDFVASRSPSSRAGGGSACSRSDERETRRRGLTDVSTSQTSKSRRPLTGRRNCAIYTPVGLMAGVFILIANTLVWPVESLSSSITCSSEPSGGILHLRGGENPTTPMKAPLTRSKRTYTEAASLSGSSASSASWAGPSRLANSASLSPPSTTYSNDHKRAGTANGSRTARAKEAVARLYKQGSGFLPKALADIKALPLSTYAVAQKKIKNAPAALREHKRRFDAMPREVFLKQVVLPAAAVIAFGAVLPLLAQGPGVARLLQELGSWRGRAQMVSREVWAAVLRSPAVGAKTLAGLYKRLAHVLLNPYASLKALSAAASAAISGTLKLLAAAVRRTRARGGALGARAAKLALLLLADAQRLLKSAEHLVVNSPRRAGMLVYWVTMALITAQGRWQSVQAVSYVVDRFLLSPLSRPSMADVYAKLAWWQCCCEQWVRGRGLQMMRPNMIYVELLMQNLYKVASLPIETVGKAVATLRGSPTLQSKPSVAVSGFTIMKNLASYTSSTSAAARRLPHAHVAAAACVLPLVPFIVLYSDALKSKLSFVVDGFSPAKRDEFKPRS